MNSAERRTVRQGLIASGFDRRSATSDISAVGDYAENWLHPDGTVITVHWAPRDTTTPTAPDAGLTEPGPDAPGMYDEPDEGLTFPLAVSDEEDRIPGGSDYVQQGFIGRPNRPGGV